MEKTIGTSDVKAFCQVAPPHVLLEIRSVIDKQLAKHGLGEKKPKPKIHSPRAPPSSPAIAIPTEDDPMSDFPSARDQLIELSSSVRSTTSGPSLKEQLEHANRADKFALDEEIVDLVFMYTDKYGDAHVRITDDDFRVKVEMTNNSCKAEGIYFPYGFGKGHDLLKIKKFDKAEAGQNIRLHLKFSKWNSNGKSGFSCYVN